MRILAAATTTLRRVVDLALVAVVVAVLLAVALGKMVPLTGRQSVIIGGSSMEPAIGLGAAVVIGPVDAMALAVGDVVSLRVGPERTTYTHRIVAVVDRADGRWIRTQGDANAIADPTLVPASAVVGRVEFAIPLMGYLLALLSLPVGVIFVLGLAATLLAIAWLLESVEPEPARARAGRPVREPWIAATVAPWPDAERGILRGAAIAARFGGVRPMAPGATLSMASATSSGSALVGSTAPGPVARPTMRVQIERSRETRRRRARWQTGRGRDPSTAD
ncbi:MAG: signal peptidase I [Candidatus Limnocylindrales bacterium]